MRDVNPETLAAWTGLAKTARALTETVEAALKAQGYPPLAWYDVLLELEKARKGLRLNDLQARLLLPQYGTSRLLDRLAREGLVEKDACPEDGRGQVARITDAGRTLRKRMWPVYAGVLNETIGDRLATTDLAHLADMLTRLNPTDGRANLKPA